MPKKQEEKQEFSETQINSFKEIITDSLGGFDSNPDLNDSAKELETAKLILASILNEKYNDSTSNLNEEEIDDISDAYYLNLIFQDQLVDEKIKRYIALKRSYTKDPKNLLTILSEIVGKVQERPEGGGGIGGILGGRFRR